MGKLVVKFQGRLIGEVNLRLGETRIGRKQGCDVVFNDPMVSGEHAVIKTVGMKSTIEDLDSKNGTFIENQRVKRHELKHGDNIIIGGHSLTYRDDANFDSPVFGARPAATPPANPSVTTELVTFAELIGVEGPLKDKHVPLVRDEVVIENPGKSPARITRIADGHLLEAQAGPGEPTLNGKPVPPGGQLLAKGDIVDVAGTKYQFFK